MKHPVTLIIMDGFGLAEASSSNAITTAGTPFIDSLLSKYSNTVLSASGEDVGLPEGQMGNSEVGHTNIGAGRIIYQDLTKITRDIKLGGFFENKAYTWVMDSVKMRGSALHLMGLLSPGGVHSHTDHLWAFIEMAAQRGIEKLYIHCFMDGRDTAPESGIESIKECIAHCKKHGTGKIATIMGRFYAMDRDKRWDRVEKAYNAMVLGEGVQNDDPVNAVLTSYENGVTDEFIEPVVCDAEGMVKQGDGIIFINFRPDRAREITRAFADPDFDGFERKNGYFPVDFVCTTRYDETMPNVRIAYPPESPTQTLGQVISDNGLTQLRIAETEKYAHVTFFFNGGDENVFPGENRILVPSPKEFPTYDLIPEMSAPELAERAAEAVKSGKYDFIVLNFANCDMVGHTGVFNSVIQAVRTVDSAVEKVVTAVSEAGGISIITADHGNAEKMMESDGVSPHTAHSTNPVPFIIVGSGAMLRPGKLCDIAPTILDIMGLGQPIEMTGRSLIIN